MSGNTCPVLLAGLMGHDISSEDKDELAECIGPRCAWWSEKYGMCYVEMIMLRV